MEVDNKGRQKPITLLRIGYSPFVKDGLTLRQFEIES